MYTSEELEALLDAARRDVISTVDQFRERSRTLDEFDAKWVAAKALYDEMAGESGVQIARRVGQQAARDLADALAIFEEHRPS